jgi:hypothetical protein
MNQILELPVETVQKAEKYLVQISSLVVTNDVEFTNAGEAVKAIKDFDKLIEKTHKECKLLPTVLEWLNFEKGIFALRKKLSGKMSLVQNAMFQFDQKKKAEARRLQEEENRKAREAQEELERKQREQLAKAEEARNSGNESLAKRFETNAATTEQKASEIIPQSIVVTQPKVDGLSLRGIWQGKVIDMPAFIKWCVSSDNMHYLDVNESKLNSRAKEHEGNNPPPGVEYYQKASSTRR